MLLLNINTKKKLNKFKDLLTFLNKVSSRITYFVYIILF